MQLHWDKLQFIQVRHLAKLTKPDGEAIAAKDFMTYLGTTINADGTMKSELGRRLGAAWGEFSKFARLWKHTSLKASKIRIFQTLIASRLLYGTSSAWLNVAEIRWLDRFQARCLRRVLNVKPAFISRTSTAETLSRFGQFKFSKQL